jgi:hypothetical protein
MNSKLRKGINVKNMLWRKYKKHRSQFHWEKYRVQRNYVTKLRKQSMNSYLMNKCNGPKTGKEFWGAVKPLISNKYMSSNDNIMLLENEQIIREPSELCNLFNDYFTHIAQDIGINDPISPNDTVNSIIADYENHPSIELIKQNIEHPDNVKFQFHHVSQDLVLSILKRLNVKKATGCDNIPPKLLRMGSDVLCTPLTYLINCSITTSCFPDMLKQAEVTPIFKNNKDVMDKRSYRPVSILNVISKVFEKVLIDQLSSYFEPIFSPHMSGFRKKYSCENVLLHFIENVKSGLDDKKHVGAVMTDLSRAFDCLPPKLLISKFRAYGVTEGSCQLMSSYFHNRSQRVKIGNCRSEWESISKGAAQGSMMGPFCYNVLCIYNYADDNTIICQDNDIQSVIHNLEYMR